MTASPPLAGLNIVVTRPREQAAQLAQHIEQEGGKVVLFPLLEISPTADPQILRALVARLHEFDLAIFISPNAVRYGMEAILGVGSLPANLKVATIGQGSAKALLDLGVKEVIAPQDRFDSEALLSLPALQTVAGWRVIIFRGNGGRELLGDTLKERGATVEYAECYQRAKPNSDRSILLAAAPHAIIITSSEALSYLWEMFDEPDKAWLAALPLFVQHTRIADTARRLGWFNVIETAEGDDGLLSSLVRWAEKRKTHMNEQVSPTEPPSPAPEPQAVPATPSHNNPLANIVARMSIAQMTLAVVLVVFLWQWFDAHRQIDNMQQELARSLAEIEGNNKASQMLVTQDQETTRELSAKVALLEAHYAEAQNQRAALETLYQELSSSRDETVLAQVEQMLLIAGQQLQLSANVRAALIAMQQADDYLKRMDRASLNGLRKTIAHDMDKLRALPNVDVAGINLRLDNLIATVDTLPLAQDIRPQQEAKTAVLNANAESGWQRLLHEIWDDAKHLVRIENMQKQELPLLSPTQTFFLRENLKLRLLSARLALLARDDTSFKHDLQEAQEWVTRYFDTKSSDGTTASVSLKALRASNISIELPDVSASLEAVRNYRVTGEKSAR